MKNYLRRKHEAWTRGAGRLISLLLAVVLVAGLVPVRAQAAGGGHFSDVPSSNWAYAYVERAYQDGAIVGTGGDPAKGTGKFSPNNEMTYGQFLTMLMNAFYPEEMAKASPKTPWYAPAIQVATNHKLTYISQNDLMNKYADFHINRYNMAWILVKLMEDKGAGLPSQQERDAAAAKIGDWSTVGADHSSWPYYVSSVVAAGIISGVDDRGTFNGSGYVTRAAASVIYTKLADKMGGTPNQGSDQTSGANPGQSAEIRQKYKIAYGEGWNLITRPNYKEDLEKSFYESYPRLVARWGGEVVQTTIQFSVKKTLPDAFMWTAYRNYDSATGVWERYVEISAKSQDSRPPSWAVPHEMTHVIQQYGNFESSWWVECMACYGEFRYYKWADAGNLTPEDCYHQDDQALRDWHFEAYGDCHWFFAYMDSKYPTTSQGRGLIDAIHYGIHEGKILSDDLNDPTLNAVVQQVTGYSTIEQLWRQYIRELDAGTWTFDGFGGYPDNYITENIPGLSNPTYPKSKDINLCNGAYTYNVTGEASAKLAANNLVDGNRATKWQAAKSDIKDSSEKDHNLCITLMGSASFDTYVLYHEGSQGDSGKNTVSWRLEYYDSSDKKWKLLDEVSGNTESVTTRKVKQVETQYLFLKILNPSGSGDGTVRLYELELYDR